MTEQQLHDIHALSMHNLKDLQNAILCGCFSCRRIFNPQEEKITEWVDEGDTALCPFCGIDSIIPQTKDLLITPALLDEMQKKWF